VRHTAHLRLEALHLLQLPVARGAAPRAARCRARGACPAGLCGRVGAAPPLGAQLAKLEAQIVDLPREGHALARQQAECRTGAPHAGFTKQLAL